MPKLDEGEWALYWDSCRECGTRERRHHSRGLCGRCYDRTLYAVLKAATDVKPTSWEKDRTWRKIIADKGLQ